MVRDDLVDRRTVGVDSRSEGPEIGNKSNFIQALEERGALAILHHQRRGNGR
jgi:hypothetical protein